MFSGIQCVIVDCDMYYDGPGSWTPTNEMLEEQDASIIM